ncbi:nickel pincer cofactor biosynthesis protein LarC [Saccharicrinis aurantiacus]|uniref:nickel pincer cofactor biosynthesis protein LarC n=1 Tax=Saccharicrinis aurantiacus TaxID=1849719 RepID=UPI002491A39B|nr:nickel pincer cofactor biosynthesis protein LarC [Saccharicrinis aurantiacus]
MEITYNCFAGISGDMNLAAMLDLGMDLELLKKELSKLGVDDEFELQVYPAQKSGINGTQVNVLLKNQAHSHQLGEHSHHHSHDEEHHHHEHSHDHHHHHSHSRNYADIEKLINASTLHEQIKTIAKHIFWEVAVAEGKVHNKPPHNVHFHEVGATDSIVDIVGAAICYHHLNITHVTSTVPELGGGFVKCDHGKMPVPAPATVEIFRGVKCSSGAVDKEMTTPTGAAILKVLTNEWIAHPEMEIIRTAYGIGHRTVEIPNVLRVFESKRSAEINQSKSLMIECNIDDMSAEDLAIVPDLLLKSGARDAYLSPIVMKKGRAATKLSVLCLAQDAEVIANTIFEHTTTIGLRKYPIDKIELPRVSKTKETPYGEVRYKESTLPSGEKRIKIEFDDLEKLAKANNLSISVLRTNTKNIIK